MFFIEIYSAKSEAINIWEKIVLFFNFIDKNNNEIAEMHVYESKNLIIFKILSNAISQKYSNFSFGVAKYSGRHVNFLLNWVILFYKL